MKLYGLVIEEQGDRFGLILCEDCEPENNIVGRIAERIEIDAKVAPFAVCEDCGRTARELANVKAA